MMPSRTVRPLQESGMPAGPKVIMGALRPMKAPYKAFHRHPRHVGPPQAPLAAATVRVPMRAAALALLVVALSGCFTASAPAPRAGGASITASAPLAVPAAD